MFNVNWLFQSPATAVIFVDSSSFQVLIGDVELGQNIPQLLDVAAGVGDEVRVFVTEDAQTAIVTDGADITLDWSRWVAEVLGNSASRANFTIRSTRLNESGYPVEGPEEVKSTDRIEVEFESDKNEYFVEIEGVVARKTDKDDPDRNVYEVEACVPQTNGSVQCFKSNITVFAIDTLPPEEDLGKEFLVRLLIYDIGNDIRCLLV